MAADNDCSPLHDKATRGATLSAVERERLDAWYAAQDAAERVLLTGFAPSLTVAALHTEIATAAGGCKWRLSVSKNSWPRTRRSVKRTPPCSTGWRSAQPRAWHDRPPQGRLIGHYRNVQCR